MEKPFIIIADPNETRAAALVEALGPAFDCLTVHDVQGALHEIRDRLPAAIVVDFPFPTGQGRCLTDALNGDPATAAIPLVAHSGWDFPRTRSKARDFGCDAFVAHQHGPEAVVRTLDELLGREQAVA